MSTWAQQRFETLFAEPLRNGITCPSKDRGQGIKLINMGEIFAYDRIGDVPADLAPLPSGDEQKWLLAEGDLLFARQSLKYEGAGKVAIVTPATDPRTWEGHLIRVRLDQEKADPRFYYYLFKSAAGRDLMGTIIEQVAAAGIRGSDLKNLQVPVPPVAEQRALAGVLWTLDDKIECTEQMAGTTEELLRVLYENLAPAEAGSQQTALLGDLLAARRETVDPGDLDVTLPYIGLAHMPRASIRLAEWGRADEVTSAKLRFSKDDILFGKLRPYFRKVGPAPVEGVCSSDILVLQAKDPKLHPYLVMLLSSEEFSDYAVGVSGGTRMPRASLSDVLRYSVALPGPAALAGFEQVASALLRRMHAGILEAQTLAEIRDVILPKLLSGELRVAEVEQAVEEVA